MTTKELHEMQKWTLEQKVFHAIEVMQSFITRMGGVDKVYVSFSGGVDSLVVLHIARKFIDKGMKAVFCNTGMEWKAITDFVKTFDNVDIIHPKMHVKEIFAKYGFPIVSKRVSQYLQEVRHSKSHNELWQKRMGDNSFYSIPKKWRYLLDKDYEASPKCCKYLKKDPFRQYEKETGRKPILGILAEESLLRTNEYVKQEGCNSFKEGKEHSWPISIWTSKDVWTFIRENNMPYCEIYDKLIRKQTGCIACGYGLHNKDDCKLQELYKRYPKMYSWFMNLENNGVKYRQALKDIGAVLPDEQPIEQDLFDDRK